MCRFDRDISCPSAYDGRMSTDTRTHSHNTAPGRWSGFIGRTADGDRVFVTIELRERDGEHQTTTHDTVSGYLELSVTANAHEAGRELSGDICRGGQYREAGEDVAAGQIAEGLTVADLDELTELWDRWHLNGMQAGCAHQTPVYRTGPYGREVDLRATPECPAVVLTEMPVTAEDYRPAYRYGSAWLVEVMPWDVVARIRALAARIAAVDEDQAEDKITTIPWEEAADRFTDMLNECHEPVTIGYSTFEAGDVLRAMAPGEFGQGVWEWAAQEGIAVGDPDDDGEDVDDTCHCGHPECGAC